MSAATRLHLRGGATYVVRWPLHHALGFWRSALDNDQAFISFDRSWVRTADIYAVEAV